MRIKHHPFSFILQLFFFINILSAQETAKASCRAVLVALSVLTESHYNSPEVYQCDFCLYNSGELGRLITQNLGEKIDQSKLRILILKHSKYPQGKELDPSDERNLLTGHAQTQARVGKPTLWLFHAVLEYEGRILDLDRVNGWEPIPLNEYIDKMFPETVATVTNTDTKQADHSGLATTYNKKSDLSVTPVQLTDYLDTFKERPRNQEDMLLIFIETHKSQSLEDFQNQQLQP